MRYLVSLLCALSVVSSFGSSNLFVFSPSCSSPTLEMPVLNTNSSSDDNPDWTFQPGHFSPSTFQPLPSIRLPLPSSTAWMLEAAERQQQMDLSFAHQSAMKPVSTPSQPTPSLEEMHQSVSIEDIVLMPPPPHPSLDAPGPSVPTDAAAAATAITPHQRMMKSILKKRVCVVPPQQRQEEVSWVTKFVSSNTNDDTLQTKTERGECGEFYATSRRGQSRDPSSKSMYILNHVCFVNLT